MAAEIVVGLEQQDAGIRLLATIKPGRRETADAGTDDDQIVALVRRGTGGIEAPAVTQRMCHIEAARGRTPKTVARWRVVCGGGIRGAQPGCGREPCRNRERRAVQEIAAGDIASHARHCSTEESSRVESQ